MSNHAEATCKKCGKIYVKSFSHQLYCSRECRQAGRSDIANIGYKKLNRCAYCGAEFLGGGKYCSQDCRVIHTNIEKCRRERARRMKAGELSPLAKINDMARREDLSYGKYLEKHGYGNFSSVK